MGASKNKQKLSHLLNFIQQYWVTVALVITLLTLLRQSLWINNFPYSLTKKQQIIEQKIQKNQELSQQNQLKQNSTNQELIESQARYRFGLVKKSERYYQIIE